MLTNSGEPDFYEEALQVKVKIVKRFQQQEGIIFTEIFSPVMKLTTVRSVLSIVVAEDLNLEQLDVKIVFLHDDFEEDIYTMQP